MPFSRLALRGVSRFGRSRRDDAVTYVYPKTSNEPQVKAVAKYIESLCGLEMPSKKAHALLKPGDKVSIPGEGLSGTVTAVHPHEAVVKLESGEHRGFALESLHRQPTFDETSDFVDH